MCCGRICALSLGCWAWLDGGLLTYMAFQSNPARCHHSLFLSSIQICICGICSSLVLKHSHSNPLNIVHNLQISLFTSCMGLMFFVCMLPCMYLPAFDGIFLSLVSRSGGHSLCGLLAALPRSPPHVLLRVWLVWVSNDSSWPLMRVKSILFV